jgi:hypothetical protein
MVFDCPYVGTRNLEDYKKAWEKARRLLDQANAFYVPTNLILQPPEYAEQLRRRVAEVLVFWSSRIHLAARMIHQQGKEHFQNLIGGTRFLLATT